MTYFQWEQQQQQEGKNRHILLIGAAAAAGADKGTIGLGYTFQLCPSFYPHPIISDIFSGDLMKILQFL